jgi:hypothetical protein
MIEHALFRKNVNLQTCRERPGESSTVPHLFHSGSRGCTLTDRAPSGRCRKRNSLTIRLGIHYSWTKK